MTKIYLFPGQGSQELGMGKDVWNEFPDEVRLAEKILGYDPVRLCLEGPEERLNQTQYTQPLLFLVEALAYRKRLLEDPMLPDFVAGHSLGEYAALFAAGSFDLETGLKLVKKRGELMSCAQNGGMAAVLGLEPEKIRAVLTQAGEDQIDLANMNSPTQTVISGPRDRIEICSTLLQNAGAKRVVILPVSGAFHSRYMAGAAQEFAEFLKGFTFHQPKITCLSNCTAKPYQSANDVPTLLVQQMTHGVRWVEIMEFFWSQPNPVFVELGPKKVLTGLAAQCHRK